MIRIIIKKFLKALKIINIFDSIILKKNKINIIKIIFQNSKFPKLSQEPMK